MKKHIKLVYLAINIINKIITSLRLYGGLLHRTQLKLLNIAHEHERHVVGGNHVELKALIKATHAHYKKHGGK